MRYRFIDEIVSIVRDPPRIEVQKTFAADDALSGPAGPRRVPNSLVLELLAMTGGHLLLRHLGGPRLPLLVRVEGLSFDCSVRPGELLRARAVVLDAREVSAGTTMAETEGELYRGRVRLVSGRLFYLCVGVDAAAAERYGALA